MDWYSIVIIFLLFWIGLNTSGILSNQRVLALGNDRLYEKLEDIEQLLQDIERSTNEISSNTSMISYDTDKIRYANGHRTEDELFEIEHNIDYGNNKEFNRSFSTQ